MIDANDALLNLAIEGIKDQRYTVKEAEEIFRIKIPEDKLSGLYITKDSGFHFMIKGKMFPDYYGWAKYFIENYKFFSHDGGYYIYDDNRKYYRLISELELDYFLTLNTKSSVSPQHRNSFIRTLVASSYKVPSEMMPRPGFLNLQNGILNVKTKKLSQHDSSQFFTYCLSHKYDATATCDKWMIFLNDVFKEKEELISIAAQIFGYILAGGKPWLHQSFVLYGDGRNGKSTFLDVLKELIGIKNYSSVSLSSLDKPFSVVNLDGKLANIVEETPNDKINAEVFKTAVGGGTMIGSKKFKDEYQFQCNSRFIFACNELPRFGESSTGILERLYLIPFKVYLDKSKRNFNILNELTSEMPGILNWAIDGLSLLMEEKRLPDPDSISSLLEEYKEESDSVYAWAVDNLSQNNDNKFIKTKDMYMKYRSDLDNSGRYPVSDITFGKRIKKFISQKIPDAVEFRQGVKRDRGYRNLSCHGVTESFYI